eukprot:tig00000042_g15527.t1
MARERAAKRSRKEEPPSSAAGPYASEAASGQQNLNPFARLPDALVQQILSNLDAVEAHEDSKLWAVDRRFRQLLPGVLWKSLKVNADAVPGDDEGFEFQAKCFQKQLQRFAERLGAGRMLGVKHLNIFRVLPSLNDDEDIEDDDFHAEMIKHAKRILNCIIGLLAVAATVASELDLVPVSLKQMAASCMAALSPAQLKSMKVSSSSFLYALASVAKPAHVLSLLEFDCTNASLSKDHAARLVAAFPKLRSLSIGVNGGEALREIAGCAYLEELNVSFSFLDDHAASALAAIAAGPSGAKLRELKLCAYGPLNAQCLASVLLFPSLEEISIKVGPDCAALLPALGRLERLKALNLTLHRSEAADGGAGLLRAGAALLGSRGGAGLQAYSISPL